MSESFLSFFEKSLKKVENVKCNVTFLKSVTTVTSGRLSKQLDVIDEIQRTSDATIIEEARFFGRKEHQVLRMISGLFFSL